MASTLPNVLPHPGAVTLRDLAVVNQSAGALVFTAVPDAAVRPRAWALRWDVVVGAVADAVLRHYEDHRLSTWSFTVPRTGEVVTVRWISSPSIRWRSSVAASVTGEIEEALAHE